MAKKKRSREKPKPITYKTVMAECADCGCELFDGDACMYPNQSLIETYCVYCGHKRQDVFLAFIGFEKIIGEITI